MLRYLLPRPVVFIAIWWLLTGLFGSAVCRAQPQQTSCPALTALGIVVLRNEGGLLPLQRLDTLRLATVKVRSMPDVVDFSWNLPQDVANYAPGFYSVGPQAADFAQLRASNLLILALPDASPRDRATLQQVLKLHKKVVVLLFDSTALAALPELHQVAAVVLAKARNTGACSQAIQVLFGGVGATGRLAPAASASWGPSLNTRGGLRLAYGTPTAAGLRPSLSALVDSLMQRALDAGAFPGGQVVVVRHGVVALSRSYGVQQAGPAAQPRPVLNNTLYDFASLTKVTAALPALMRLQDLGLFGPDYTLGALFDFLEGSDKQNLRLRDVLTHQARLKPFIPFWQDYVNYSGRLNRRYFRPDSSAAYSLPVAAGIWGSRALPARIYRGVANSPLNAKPGYVYSDFSFMLYPYYVQRASGKPFDQFVADEIYRPLGASTLGFNPERRFPRWRIAPTEYDSAFRKQLVHGTVHDENAAMLGGVSGHAGLFGTANDLAKLVQMYLWQGRYGGQQLIKAETIAEYTRCQFCPDNRRALGFDKPDPKNPALNAARSASPRSYGHTGFTGTYFWVEPDLDLFVILLTNRVNPTRRNGKLGELGVRSALLQLAIESAQP
ncbi:serine hydrolase [Hymenobacter sp. HMF4947]|uniref:Serine hydrolase n=1 Tax=Hymenobacter ginkgonis TaxID=2682976 RepID=A0A7K1TDR5_9BACT|nr:serine hydrolase [Hymenobacter ginkgonis]MVN76472.1 serine hydrolase [Hymenobacter ginkgonis]